MPKLPFRRVFRQLQKWAFLSLAGAVVAANVIAFVWVARYTFAIHRLKQGVGDTVFYDGRGRPWFRMDEQRLDVPLSAMSPHLKNAVLAVEDHRFYRHPGIDVIAVGRALFENARARGIAEGGSTITQQLARTLFLSNQRTFARKFKEAVLALLLEQQLTKDQILEFYLNRVYLSGGVYGVENISRQAFGKKARDLELPEAAMIAGLIRAPSALSPWSNLEGARNRAQVVLARMREQNRIDVKTERAALSAAVRVRPFSGPAGSRHGYAKEYLRQQFRDRFGGDHPPDWQVHTTFLPELQDAAERAVTRGLRQAGRPGLQAALVAIDPQTGDLLAMVGGRDFARSQFNRAVRSRRQPGSAFKPFLFARALEDGYSPVSVVQGLNEIPAGQEEEWNPRNVHGETPDELTLRQALLESNNRAAAALQRDISTRPVLRLAGELGMNDLPDVPSLALGTGLVSPLEITAAYGAFANGGFAVKPRGIRRILDSDGAEALTVKPARERALSEQVAFQMVSMLRDVVDRGTGAGARRMGVRFQAAGKTGTTNEYKDAWFIGFSNRVVAGVWVGFDQPGPISRNGTGARIALPVWADFMRQAARYVPPGEFEKPPGLREEELCRISYQQPLDDCPTYVEYFKSGDRLPSRLCTVHSGTLKQRARRAVQGIFGAINERLRGIFE